MSSITATTRPGSGGLTVTAEMLDILKQPGYITESNGGKRLRDLYRESIKHYLGTQIALRADFWNHRLTSFQSTTAL